ncbi:hypothetical protein GCM10011378_41250 [Hymenobacter glacieicola]|uniref:KTSC domain-containing protein n=1 Tax=Hymenobacter glacieicola TaxID=1562124 RepID=A0ABQ1X8T7_9BACT|nr:hypothetical protein GCM10011378_41250 [Hymenobacter glacieicola]
MLNIMQERHGATLTAHNSVNFNQPEQPQPHNTMDIITLDPKSATYEAIAAVAGNSVNKQFRVEVGHKKLIVERKCTYQYGVVKTSYRHILSVLSWENPRVVAHYRETKTGDFRQL